MIRFLVSVRTFSSRVEYFAVARSSFDLLDSAIDHFGPCRITVRAA